MNTESILPVEWEKGNLGVLEVITERKKATTATFASTLQILFATFYPNSSPTKKKALITLKEPFNGRELPLFQGFKNHTDACLSQTCEYRYFKTLHLH